MEFTPPVDSMVPNIFTTSTTTTTSISTINNNINSINDEMDQDTRQKIKILLVEDNSVNRKVISMQLKKIGYECDTAENGLVGFERYKENGYDLILMDLNMPECDGAQSSKLIRSYEKSLNRNISAYIVGLSATCLQGSKDYCKNMGMNEYAAKPLKLHILQNIIEGFLNKKRK
ncbi:hypothetical protein CYY_002875 [Polysphondylium violaceum]|uniref:Response regulatory domain-containing protein n=1 Tax=Polysphondylium violaceum TaxID=133409 RepID=A0A8J4UUS6_9MYCE|nr:hypothetical protein CYY_002875 [Polysphondylium violaceum]